MRKSLYLYVFMILVFALNVMAYLNMVARMGYTFSLDIFVGPTIVAIILTTVICALISFFNKKLFRVEDEKRLALEVIQQEIIYKMGEIGESRCAETGNHVKRVAEFSYLLARLYGLEDEEAKLLRSASPMHDIGKVAIPDNVLLKPGRLTIEEFEVMKQHAKTGYDLLHDSEKKIFQAAAVVAHEHHEKWDGTGYPRGLKGEEIHIFGRIVALVDVFDALSSARVYKEAWSIDAIQNYIADQKGRQFDPTLAQLFLDNFDKFVFIQNHYKD